MAVLNFPDPAGQDPVDTYSPTSTPHQTSNGVTYVWTDGSWSIASTSNGELLTKDEADSYYVEQSGDNMTGPLTLGGDKITLGVDGSAEFAGSVDIGAYDVNDTASGMILGSNGTLNSSGNGYFGLKVTAANGFESGQNSTYGAILYTTSAQPNHACLYARNYDNSGTGNIIYCETPTGGNAFTVNTSGAATFGGETKAPVFRTANGNAVISETGADKSGSMRLTNGTAANNEYIPLNITANDASKPTFRVTQFGENSKLEMGGSGADADITLNSNDGSGTFAGTVTAGSGSTFYGFVGVNGGGNSSNYAAFYGACLDSSGRVFVGSDVSSGTDTVTSKIYANGSATFTDTAAGGGEIYLARAGYAIDVWSGGARTYGITFGGSAGFRELSLDLEPENDANYVTTTDVDEEGNTVETRVYNGPTLDVKAVIQELQQRVADRDAVIANLTTRIQALEGGNN